MKVSELLFNDAKELWDASMEKDFLLQMAHGTLPPERFRNYMLQDYLYLQGYLKVIELTKAQAKCPEQIAFLDGMLQDAREEMLKVHVPNMKQLGITEEDMHTAVLNDVSRAYLEYMQTQVTEGTLLLGLVVLLNCSWEYAYLAKMMLKCYPDDIMRSPYRSWFFAYGSETYEKSNQAMIDFVDGIAGEPNIGLSNKETKELCRVFKECSSYEDRLWDAL